MIFMFLSPGNVEGAGVLYGGQAALQVLLLLAAFAAVPWMLLPKPLILKKRAELFAADDADAGTDSGDEDDDGPIPTHFMFTK